MSSEHETDDERLARFREGNDKLWGAGNWIVCHECPTDTGGRFVFHHKYAHATPEVLLPFVYDVETDVPVPVAGRRRLGLLESDKSLYLTEDQTPMKGSES